MTIKTKLRAIALLPLLVFVAVSAIQYWASGASDSLSAQAAVVDQISRTTTHLITLTCEYGITGAERAATQWNIQCAATEQLLRKIPDVVENPAYAPQFGELRRLLRKSQTLFSELRAYDKRLDEGGRSKQLTELRNTMVNRLILEQRTAPSLSESILAGIDETRQRSIRYGSLITTGIVLSLALSLLAFTFWVIGGISSSLRKFQRGIEAVSGGDLEFRVNLANSDELGDLARGFDKMTEKLARVTISRDEITREIAARRQAEDALTASEAKLHLAQRIARIGSWALDSASNTLICSDESYRIFEIDPQECGASYEAFLNGIHPDDREMVNQAYTRSLETRQPFEVEHRLLLKDGRIKFVHERCETRFDANGKPLLSIGAVQDISERRQVEEQIKKLHQELELRVAGRTRELEEKSLEVQETQRALMNIVEDLNQKTMELEEANLRLQELDRLKSMFIATMSHELRTPLNSIIGFSSIVQKEWLGPLNEDQKEKLAIVLRTGKHLLSLINDLIDISKIEAGKVEIVRDEFDLHDLLLEAAALSEADLAVRGIRLQVETIHLILHADRRRLYQCVVNLLGNAAKFTLRGAITVKAELVHDRKAPAVTISVTDTGIGIREEDISKLFCSFVRLPLPEDMQAKGTGLGLYLVKKIVTEILGGTVGVASTIGEGSTFSLTLPV